MDPKQPGHDSGGLSRAELASSGSTSRPQEPGPSLGTAPPISRHAKFDQMAQNYSESQAAASSAGDSHFRYRKRDMRPDQDPSTPQGQQGDAIDSMTESGATTDEASLYSYHSARDLSAFVKEFQGRIFNNQSDLYVMPSDDTEFERLNKQHYALVLGLDGLFPCADIVHRILHKRYGHQRRAILDLGCGSGIWAIEIATQFPKCEVVGLDLAPVPVDLETLPPNLRFEIDDINLGLSHYHGRFDVIHVRCIGAGIADYDKMMRDVEACLRPGGIVFFIDGDMTLYQEDMITPVPMGLETDEGGDPNDGSWLHRMTREIRYAAVYNGCDIDGLENCIDRGLWGHELLEPSTIKVASLNTPLGTWAKCSDMHTQQRLLYAGSLIRQDCMRVSSGWHPMLGKYGIPKETLVEWSKRLDDELTSEKFRMSLRWRFAWGRRRLSDSTDIPPVEGHRTTGPDRLDEGSEPTRILAGTCTDYRFLDIYHTREEAAAIMASRRLEFGKLPETMVARLRRLAT